MICLHGDGPGADGAGLAVFSTGDAGDAEAVSSPVIVEVLMADAFRTAGADVADDGGMVGFLPDFLASFEPWYIRHGVTSLQFGFVVVAFFVEDIDFLAIDDVPGKLSGRLILRHVDHGGIGEEYISLMADGIGFSIHGYFQQRKIDGLGVKITVSGEAPGLKIYAVDGDFQP